MENGEDEVCWERVHGRGVCMTEGGNFASLFLQTLLEEGIVRQRGYKGNQITKNQDRRKREWCGVRQYRREEDNQDVK